MGILPLVCFAAIDISESYFNSRYKIAFTFNKPMGMVVSLGNFYFAKNLAAHNVASAYHPNAALMQIIINKNFAQLNIFN